MEWPVLTNFQPRSEIQTKIVKTYREWKDEIVKDAREGRSNRAELRRCWRQDKKFLGARHMTFGEWKRVFIDTEPKQ